MSTYQGMSARQYFLWARERALFYVSGHGLGGGAYDDGYSLNKDDAGSAMSSLVQDLARHPGTKGILSQGMLALFMGEIILDGARGARRFINDLPEPLDDEGEEDRLPGMIVDPASWPDPDARPSY